MLCLANLDTVNEPAGNVRGAPRYRLYNARCAVEDVMWRITTVVTVSNTAVRVGHKVNYWALGIHARAESIATLNAAFSVSGRGKP